MKMSDVFNLPLVASRGDVLTDNDGLHIAYSCDAEAIALAVNNHDKLVEALERIKDAPLGTLHRTYATDALQAIKGDK